jgi:hypothetical protein
MDRVGVAGVRGGGDPGAHMRLPEVVLERWIGQIVVGGGRLFVCVVCVRWMVMGGGREEQKKASAVSVERAEKKASKWDVCVHD